MKAEIIYLTCNHGISHMLINTSIWYILVFEHKPNKQNTADVTRSLISMNNTQLSLNYL